MAAGFACMAERLCGVQPAERILQEAILFLELLDVVVMRSKLGNASSTRAASFFTSLTVCTSFILLIFSSPIGVPLRNAARTAFCSVGGLSVDRVSAEVDRLKQGRFNVRN
jgi:hypothetical protein